MSLVLEVASCTSVYKQAPKQTFLTGVKSFMFMRLVLFGRKLYFCAQAGTRTNLFNGGLVVYVLWLGAFSLILYFRVQTGTRTTLFNGGLVVYAFWFWCF